MQSMAGAYPSAMAERVWPLSAAATELLGDPRLPPTAVLKLALRELVLRGCWKLGRPRPRSLGPRKATVRVVQMDATGRKPPPLVPLPVLDDALGLPGALDLHVRLRRALLLEPELPDRLREHCLDHLTALGLLEPRTERRFGVLKRSMSSRTQDGDRVVEEAAARLDRLRRAEDDVALPATVRRAGGLILLLEPGALERVRARVAALPPAALETDAGDGVGSDLGHGGNLRFRALLQLELQNLEAGPLDLLTFGQFDVGTFEWGIDGAVDGSFGGDFGGWGGDGGAGGGDGGGGGGDGGGSGGGGN